MIDLNRNIIESTALMIHYFNIPINRIDLIAMILHVTLVENVPPP